MTKPHSTGAKVLCACADDRFAWKKVAFTRTNLDFARANFNFARKKVAFARANLSFAYAKLDFARTKFSFTSQFACFASLNPRGAPAFAT